VVALASKHAPEVAPTATTTRFLDRHYIIDSGRHPGRRCACEVAMFDTIADVYDFEIDRAANERNIRLLLSLVRHHGPDVRPQRVLDFGCGTGNSLLVADRSYTITGADASAQMRRIASSRGLNAVAPDGLQKLGSGWAAGVIASYVMHLCIPQQHLALVRTALVSGGVFCANFHKGARRRETATLLESWSFSRIDPGPHEHVEVWRKA
jgi:predicted TPR repeat methyltransferase